MARNKKNGIGFKRSRSIRKITIYDSSIFLHMQTQISTPSDLVVKRQTHSIERDETRVICRLLAHSENPSRVKNIVHRVLQLDDRETHNLLQRVLNNFSKRHRNIEMIFSRHYQQIQPFIPADKHTPLSDERKLLIGAYFTMEYAIESAALFNPSIVPHPDQSDVDEGCTRFIMSFRAVGEGHISSMVFRSGIMDRNGELSFDPEKPYVNTPEVINPVYKRHPFQSKLDEINKNNEITDYILSRLPDEFTFNELKEEINYLSDKPEFLVEKQQKAFHHLQRLADSNYQLQFSTDSDLSERVIFPVAEEERGGIEDGRFVRFQEENGEIVYYGIYTAYDGTSIMPQMIETRDFRHFKIRTLNGKAVRNKGMALFPRKVDGKYVMLSRQDGENNHIMYSDHLRFWDRSKVIQRPNRPWEFVQIGNCGSPIETEYGWLVLTHGVGPVRTYSIGAILLDLEKPEKMIGWLEEPLLKATEEERSGYVPNVVYTCGGIKHNGRLIIPYSVSDIQPALASVRIDELVDAMKEV